MYTIIVQFYTRKMFKNAKKYVIKTQHEVHGYSYLFKDLHGTCTKVLVTK